MTYGGRKEGGREGRKRGREGWKKGGREEGREGGEGGKEGKREEGKVGREGGRRGGGGKHDQWSTVNALWRYGLPANLTE